MARRTRSGWRTALWLFLALGPGCSPATFYFFLPENKDDAQLQRLIGDDTKKEVRVVILTYSNKLETRPELIGSERDLAQQFAARLQEGCKTNSENVVIVNPRKVEDFKNSHPGWSEADLSDIGRHFKADYVIYLELNQLSLFNKADMNSQYKGHIDMSVSLIDVNKPDGSPKRKEFVCSYPSEAKAIPIDGDMPINQFREVFFKHITRKLSWYFTEHLPREAYMLDD
jgi:hypothetical protein